MLDNKGKNTKSTSLTIVERRGILKKEAIDTLPYKEYFSEVTATAKFLAVTFCIAGLAVCAFGIWLVTISDDDGQTSVGFFGQSIQTDSIGIVAIFLGAVIVTRTINKVFRFLTDQLPAKKP